MKRNGSIGNNSFTKCEICGSTLLTSKTFLDKRHFLMYAHAFCMDIFHKKRLELSELKSYIIVALAKLDTHGNQIR